MQKNIIIAIDGPAGSGKSTLAKYIATHLGFKYLDTGAMYRTITYLAIKANATDSADKIINIAGEAKFDLNFVDGKTIVTTGGVDITEAIRTPEINENVSDVAKIPEVRELLVEKQRAFGREHNVVLEGRDTTTVVFPNADIKVFMVAGIETRAKRRLAEFKDAGETIDAEEVAKNLLKRDKIDSERKTAPLKKADGAIEIDSSGLTIEEEFDIVYKKLQEIDKSFNKAT